MKTRRYLIQAQDLSGFNYSTEYVTNKGISGAEAYAFRFFPTDTYKNRIVSTQLTEHFVQHDPNNNGQAPEFTR